MDGLEATHAVMAVFLFLYFLFSFFTKIYFRFGNLQEYTPAAPLPGGRDLAARQRGGRGICEKNFRDKIARRSLGPVARQRGGRPSLAARQRGGRPWPPGCGATGRNFYNLAFFAKEFHICALFVTFCRNSPWGRRRDNTSWRHRSRRRGATHAQAI